MVLPAGVSRFHLSFRQHSYTLVPAVVSRVGCRDSKQDSYMLVPPVVSRVGLLQMTFFPATFLHAGARSGVACRSAVLYVSFQQHSYTLVPAVVSRVGVSRFPATFLHAGAHSGVACRNVAHDIFQYSYTLPATFLHAGARIGVACMSVALPNNIPTCWCPQWCRV